MKGGRSDDARERNSFLIWLGRLGEQYVDRQTGDINNVDKGNKRHILRMSPIKTYPDSLDFSLGSPPIVSEVKVGHDTNIVQATIFAKEVKAGNARPGIIHFLESPGGEIGATRDILGILRSSGFSFVYARGEWWIAFQSPLSSRRIRDPQ